MEPNPSLAWRGSTTVVLSAAIVVNQSDVVDFMQDFSGATTFMFPAFLSQILLSKQSASNVTNLSGLEDLSRIQPCVRFSALLTPSWLSWTIILSLEIESVVQSSVLYSDH